MVETEQGAVHVRSECNLKAIQRTADALTGCLDHSFFPRPAFEETVCSYVARNSRKTLRFSGRKKLTCYSRHVIEWMNMLDIKAQFRTGAHCAREHIARVARVKHDSTAGQRGLAIRDKFKTQIFCVLKGISRQDVAQNATAIDEEPAIMFKTEPVGAIPLIFIQHPLVKTVDWEVPNTAKPEIYRPRAN